ncbi:MAG TPA: tyrosine-type recombinase/integrase [Acidobacteriaceae bacterium]
MGTPVITIFVRHAAECKYHGDEFSRRCKCRKHFRWSHKGKQFRKQAGTRSWEEAEEIKRQLQDQLAGRTTETRAADNVRSVSDAVSTFITDKKVQGVTPGVIKRYTSELGRLSQFCERKSVYTVQGITRDLLTDFCATWETFYPSSNTRSKVRERCRSFLRYCYEAKWLERIPPLPNIKVDEPPTMPLTAEEYERLLDAIHVVCPLDRKGGMQRSEGLTEKARAKLHALMQLMRYSGLAIGDALTLQRSSLVFTDDIHRVVTSRQKTGTHVSVPIPHAVAEELLALTNVNPKYIFWSGEGLPNTVGKMWANRYIRPLFEAAGLATGRMLSHRLRDTFAVDLLEKGVPMEEVSKLLGHTSIRTTEKHYAKWVKGRQDRLDKLVIGTWATPKTRRRAYPNASSSLDP